MSDVRNLSKVRVRYFKTGKAKYISHLDLQATMQRAFLRSGFTLKYSEGFNPHPHISVALPLPVGVESDCELMDIIIEKSNLNDKASGFGIDNFLPEGLTIQKAYQPMRKFSAIKWVEILCSAVCGNFGIINAEKIKETLNGRFGRKSLIIEKKSKSGIRSFDISGHIREISVQISKLGADANFAGLDMQNEKDGMDFVLTVRAKISAQEPTVNCNDIISIINLNEDKDCQDMPLFENFQFKRIEIYDKDMVLFT
ncbi:MAG: TIGR03936 family radical SAM-associated protein [Oscillospiraceae bacterium]|nr:TIGR03936 family radical SAM-associated protein [Oscillospiraceae bacterium]